MKKITNAILLLLFTFHVYATIWQVGPTRTYLAPSAVEGLVTDGDTIEIDAGIYNDCSTWNANNLFIEGVGAGYAHLENVVCGSKGIFVIYGTGITIKNIEFSGAVISNADGENGAGIRAQGGSLTVRNCYIHNNQDGILENPADTITDILIENSVFEFNGCDTGAYIGYEHNMYIGNARSFTIRYSYTHGAVQGHDIKTRADKNYILYNRIMDDTNGTASRNIDIPNGGQAIIMGNIIEKGPNTPNNNSIEFGMEGFVNPGPQNLYMINNTFVNDRSGCGFLDLETGTDTMQFINNIIAGPSVSFFIGAAPSVMDSATNWITANTLGIGLVNPATYDYRLVASSGAINAGSVAGHFDTLSLTPGFEYIDSAGEEPRVSIGNIDMGAYEYDPPLAITNITPNSFSVKVYPTPASDKLTIAIINVENMPVTIALFDITGREITSFNTSKSSVELNTDSFSPGIYMLRAITGNSSVTDRVVIVK